MLCKAYYVNIIVLDYKNKSFLLKTTLFSKIIPANNRVQANIKDNLPRKKMFLLSSQQKR